MFIGWETLQSWAGRHRDQGQGHSDQGQRDIAIMSRETL
jgi:hypothetical protein